MTYILSQITASNKKTD